VTPPLTYLQYLAVAVVPVAAALLVVALHRGFPRRQQAGVALMVTIALAYTTPWDNYLVRQGVWYYGEGTVLTTIWHAPLGEYLFIVLQSLLAALWVYLVLGRRRPTPAFHVADVGRRARLAGVVAGLVLTVVGLALTASHATYYLGAIVAWAGPVWALQWGFGWQYLWLRRRSMLLAVVPPTLYLWATDLVAIELGLWTISAEFTTGLALAGLPVEEAVFFLVTNLFVAQGLVLLEGVLAAVSDPLGRLSASYPALRGVVERWA
jgi:lycopene cyclase domain-containing protein